MAYSRSAFRGFLCYLFMILCSRRISDIPDRFYGLHKKAMMRARIPVEKLLTAIILEICLKRKRGYLPGCTGRIPRSQVYTKMTEKLSQISLKAVSLCKWKAF